jgi:hypothetical protein
MNGVNPAAIILLVAHGLVYYLGPKIRAKKPVAYFGAQITLAIAIGMFVASLWSMGVLLGALGLQAAVLLYGRMRNRRRS